MDAKKYLEKMLNIQQNLLEYIDDADTETSIDKFKKFKEILSTNKIQDNEHDLKSFLYLLTKISNNHHRSDDFFNRIERILEYLKEYLAKNFSNSELFHIFKSNKRILLFLIEEKMILL